MYIYKYIRTSIYIYIDAYIQIYTYIFVQYIHIYRIMGVVVYSVGFYPVSFYTSTPHAVYSIQSRFAFRPITD